TRARDLALQRSRIAEERLGELARRHTEYEREIEWTSSALKELETQWEAAEGGKERLSREIEQLQRQEEELQGRMASLESDRKAKALRIAEREKRRRRLLEERQGGQEALLALRVSRHDRLLRSSLLREERDRTVHLLSDLHRQYKESEQESARVWNEEQIVQTELLLWRESAEATAAQLSRTEEAAREAAAEEAKLCARREALREVTQEESDAPGELDRLVQEARHRGFSIDRRGALLARMRVRPGYEAAIAALLGARAAALLVRDREEAGQLVRLWETCGRSSCVLAPLASTSREGQATYQPPAALAFVQADPPVLPLLESLLSQAVVAESIEEALAAWQEGAGNRIVTRSGVVLAADGLFDCGSLRPETAAIFRRQNEPEEIERALAAARERKAIAREDSRKIQQRAEEARSRWETLEQKRRLLEIERWKRHESQKSRWESQEQARASLVRLDTELAAIEQGEGEATKSEKSWEESMARTQQDLLALTQDAQEEETSLSALCAEAGELSQAVVIGRERLQSLRLGLEERSMSAEALQEKSHQARRRLAECEANRRRSLEDAGTLRDEVEKSRREEATTKACLEEIEKQWKEAVAARSQLAEEEAAMEERVREERNRLAQSERRLASIAVELAALRPERNHLVEAAKASCGIDIEETERTMEIGEEAGSPTVEEDEEEAARWRAQLDALGSVDAEAAEALAREEKRREALVTQKRDLLDAQREMKEALAQMEAHARIRFLETFASIREHLQDSFHHLFRGGKTTISLQGEDPLSAGIEIAAQPPGKRLRNLSLLSGGERTLTALSLLFALYRVKPSPFCILDDMDAPLDEASLRSFLSLIFHFRNSSQFLIITHNRHTVAAADTVFGVTMPEQGVSRIYSLRYPAEQPQRGEPEGVRSNSRSPAFL
ncbi:MAG: hypothetical protein PHO89_08450, partial [Methylacidiphilaceae bacterium]|nr:hypothetical protein [Candidatus Methylacidiphilaceae bacterium]